MRPGEAPASIVVFDMPQACEARFDQLSGCGEDYTVICTPDKEHGVVQHYRSIMIPREASATDGSFAGRNIP
jgi:hypothetical protein